MKRKQIKLEVKKMMDEGRGKTEIFCNLVSRGAKEQLAAHYIASYVDERLGLQHEGKVKVLITIMFIQTLFGFLFGDGIGLEKYAQNPWLMGLIIVSIPLLFVWGFYKQSVTAITYISYSLRSSAENAGGLSETQVETAIGIAVSLRTLWLVLYIRSKLFPEFAAFSPKKAKGRYVFSC